MYTDAFQASSIGCFHEFFHHSKKIWFYMLLSTLIFFHALCIIFIFKNDTKTGKKYQFFCSYLGKILSSRSAKLIGGRD